MSGVGLSGSSSGVPTQPVPPAVQNAAHQNEQLPKWVIIMNGIHVFCSVPILSIPYAMKEGGWRSLAALAFFCVASAFTSYLLGICFSHHQPIKSLPEVARQAFGGAGFWVVLVIVFLYNYASCVESVVIAMDTLTYVFQKQVFSVLHHGITVGILITYIMIILLFFVVCYHNFEIFDFYLTATGVILTLVLVLGLLMHGIVDKAKYQMKSTELFNPSTFPMALGFYAYCFVGHVYLPELYQSMRNKEQYLQIMILIFLPSFALYLAVAGMGYALFGKDVKSIFVLSMPKNQVPTTFVIISMLLHQVIRYILGICSISRDFDDLVTRQINGQGNHAIGYVGRAVFVGTTIVFSLMIPVYGPLMAFIGSTFGIVVALIIPCVCFLRLRWGHVSLPQGAFAGMVILGALVAAAFGIAKSFPELIKGVEN